MKKSEHIIVGIHVTDRMKHASDVQEIFTEYGCNIKTRLGLHEVQGNYCAVGGVVVLEMVGEMVTIDGMLKKLKKIEGVEAKKMTFSHD